MEKFKTIPQLFMQVTSEWKDRDVYGYKEDGEWKLITYSEVYSTVENLAYGLASLGVERGDRVAILSANNPKWAMSDFAIASLGAVSVTVYPTLIASQIRYILVDSGAKVIIAEDQEQTAKILGFIDDCHNLKTIIEMDNNATVSDKLLNFDDTLEKGKEYKNTEPFVLEERAKSVQSDDLLTLIYTSGTTGEPKGVMLTHNNLASNVLASKEVLPIDDNDVFLSFLPLSHSFERMAGHYTAFYSGATIYYAEGIDKVADNIREVSPTLMTSVPRLYEKMYTKVLDKVSNDPALRQKIFWWAVGIGSQAVKYRQRNEEMPSGLKFKFKIADKLVFSKLKAKLGGKLRFFASGAAPLAKEIGEFFASAGIIILEGYGLTETSPVITVNRLDAFRFGTVGKPIPDVEVKIADDGEILSRGPNLMKGYYNNPEATAEAIDEDGWFHTGDIGMFDEDGFLAITDRKKNLIVTSGGKNIAPAPIENSLATSKYVDQCLVIGDRRKFVSALIVPSFEVIEEYAKNNQISIEGRNELVKHPAIVSLYSTLVEKAMVNFAHYESIKKFALIPNEWTIEGEELTPTLKVKRRVVETKYSDFIDGIYAES